MYWGGLLGQGCPDEVDAFNTVGNFALFGNKPFKRAVTDAGGSCGNAMVFGTDQNNKYRQEGAFLIESVSPIDQPGQTHRISFRYRASQAQSIALVIRSQRTGSTLTTTNYVDATLSATTSYQTYSVDVTSARQAGDASHFLAVQFEVGQVRNSDIFIDQLTIESFTPCQDEGPRNELADYFTYRGVAATEVADLDGVCDDALRVVAAATQPTSFEAGFILGEAAALPDEAGKYYRLSFRYRADATRPLAYSLNSRVSGDNTGVNDENFTTGTLTATTSYQTFSTVVASDRLPAETDRFLSLVFGLGDATDAVYLDDIVLEQTPCPTATVFENLTRWGTYQQNGAALTTSTVYDASATCNEAFRIDVSATGPNPFDAGFQITEGGTIADEGGKSYRVRFRYRADAPRNFDMQLRSRKNGTGGTDDVIYQEAFTTLSATTVYQEYSEIVTSPRDPADGGNHLHIILAVAGDLASVYLDDFVMEEVVSCAEESAYNALPAYEGFGTVTGSRVADAAGTCGDALQLQAGSVQSTIYDGGLQLAEPMSLDDQTGKFYQLSFRYRAASTRDLALTIKSRRKGTTGGGSELDYHEVILTATPTYQTHTITVASQREAAELDYFLHLAFYLGDDLTPVLVDDISLVEIPCDLEGDYNTLSWYDTYSNTGNPLATAEVFDAEGICKDAFELTFTGPDGGNPYDAGFQILRDFGFPDEAGKTYRVSFRYRATVDRPVSFLLFSREFDNFDGANDDQYLAETVTATTNYQRYTALVNSVRQTGETTHHLYFLIGNGNSTAPLYLDDIVFEEYTPHHTVPGTFYVRPDGDDLNDGLTNTPGGALQTLQFALSTLVPGDSLLVADGVYQENGLTIDDVAATAGQPVVVRAINPWGAKIEGRDSYDPVLRIFNSSYVTVEGFEVYNPLDDPVIDWSSGIQSHQSNHVTIQNNYVHDCGCNGVSAREGDYLTIARNVLRDNAKTSPYNCSGVSIYQPIALDNAPGFHIVVRQNVAFENECRLPFSPQGIPIPTDGNGIILDDFNWTQGVGTPYTPETLVENNLTFHNGGAGIKTYEVANATLRNNTAYHNNYVLSEHTLVAGELTFQGYSGTLKVYNNVAQQPYGQSSLALSAEDFGRGGSIATHTNVWIGGSFHQGGSLNQTADRSIAEDRQSYPQFADALAAIPAFANVNDFRPLFGLRAGSSLLDAGNDALAAPAGLSGTVRPQGAATDIGAFEGVVADGGPLPEDVTLVASIPKSLQPPVVDGQADFYTGPLLPLTKSLLSPLTDPTDLGGAWTATWTEDSLYVFVAVTDDVLVDDSDLREPLLDDGVSVFFDLNNDKSSSYGSDDLHFVYGYQGDGDVRNGTSGFASTHRAAAVIVPGGYQVEFAFGLGTLGLTAADSSRFGLEVTLNDDDNGGDNLEHQLAWQATGPGAATNPSLFGEGLLRVLATPPPVFFTPTAITIDGVAEDAWQGSPIHLLNTPFLDPILDASDLSARWRAVWDHTALYFLVTVTDEDLRNDSPEARDDDGIEIYLDADNSKDFGRYGPNDYHLTLDYRATDGAVTVTDRRGQLGAGATAQLRHISGGYVIEAALPWSALGVTARSGHLLGIDVHANDDDAGGERDSKLSWYAAIDRSSTNPAVFGTVYLAPGATATLSTPGCQQAEQYLSLLGEANELPVEDLDGTNFLLFTTDNAGTTYTIDAATAGLYTLDFRLKTDRSTNLDVYVDGQYANRIRVRTPRGKAAGWHDFRTFLTLPQQAATLTVRAREASILAFNNFCLEPGHTDSVARDR